VSFFLTVIILSLSLKVIDNEEKENNKENADQGMPSDVPMKSGHSSKHLPRNVA
jgi:hypothetical protein